MLYKKTFEILLNICDKTIQVLAGYLAKACRSANYFNYIILLKGNLPSPSHTY
jgi:hypothetical protein